MTTQPYSAMRGHILIVEDETGIRTAMSLVLEMEGFQVSQAGDGRQGLHSLLECVPDLIITDYMMPSMNGLEMIREIRAKEEFRTLPIIMLTAAFPSEPDYKTLVDVFLSKPVNVMTLVGTIQTLLDRPSSSI